MRRNRFQRNITEKRYQSRKEQGAEKKTDVSHFLSIITGALIIILFFFSAHKVIGISMYPTLHDGQFVISVRLLLSPGYGDIVIANSSELSELLIKRVIGLPGDVITVDTQGRIHVNGDISYYGEGNALTADMSGMQQLEDGSFQVILGDKEFFLVGDNHENSTDSRRLGPVEKGKILEKVILPAS